MPDSGRANVIPGVGDGVVVDGWIADREVADGLQARLLAEGGFTVDPRNARPVRRGVAVCVYPAMTLSFRLTEWSDHVVLGWVRSSRRFVRTAAQPDLCLGGWRVPDRDHIHLDLVRVMAPHRRRVAEHAGRLHGQRAVFDLTRRALIPLAVS